MRLLVMSHEKTLAVAMSYDPPAYVASFAESRQLPFKVAIDNTGEIARLELGLANVALERTRDGFFIGSNVAVSALRKVIPDKVRLPAFITIIASFVTVLMMAVKAFLPDLDQALGVYLPLITTNCCVLGVTILAVQDYSAVVAEFGFGLAYAEALICAAGAGVGFLVAMLLFCGVRSRVEAANPPESFKGLPITLVSAAITSMSFMGFGGLVENIINAIF